MTPHVTWTLKAIARRLGVGEEETVIAYATRVRDPLRLRIYLGRYWMKTERIDAYRARQQPGNKSQRIAAMGAIATRLRIKSVKTVRRLARRERDPLPVNDLGARPWIYESALLDWVDAQDRPFDPAKLPTRHKSSDESCLI